MNIINNLKTNLLDKTFVLRNIKAAVPTALVFFALDIATAVVMAAAASTVMAIPDMDMVTDEAQDNSDEEPAEDTEA